VAGVNNAVRHCYIQHCTNGVNILDGVNSLDLAQVCAKFNTNGMVVGGTDSTTFYVHECRFRQNTIGVVVNSAQLLQFNNCVIESNASYGALIFNNTTDIVGNPEHINNVLFLNCWLENN